MAKDDYHVIVYQILSYLYQQLKRGYSANPDCLRNDGKLFSIPEKYWEYIIYNLAKDELICESKSKSENMWTVKPQLILSVWKMPRLHQRGLNILQIILLWRKQRIC